MQTLHLTEPADKPECLKLSQYITLYPLSKQMLKPAAAFKLRSPERIE